jgi:hypothetical protein
MLALRLWSRWRIVGAWIIWFLVIGAYIDWVITQSINQYYFPKEYDSEVVVGIVGISGNPIVLAFLVLGPPTVFTAVWWLSRRASRREASPRADA